MAKTPTTASKRTRRTKAETQQEFEAIQQEALDSVAKSSKQNEFTKLHEEEIRAAFSEVNVDGIAQKVSHLSLEISRTLSNLSEKMIAEVNFLAKLREGVQLENQELERLHKIDVSLIALEQLIEDYDTQKIELENEIAQKRLDWEEEQELRAKKIKEDEELLKKNRQREIEDFEYKKNLERKKEHDKNEEEIRQRDKKNREHQEILEKNWKEREAALKSQEEELAHLRKEVSDYPNKLKKELDKAVADAIKQTEQRVAQEKILLERDRELERKMAELKIKALEETIAQQKGQITLLQARFEDATRQVQDIAVKAIEGASGSKTLSHINQIAMEQAKNRVGSLN
jgi:colicin import membrane protein